MVDGLLSDSDLSRSGTNTESKLDALIARIHNLGSSKNASTAGEKRPSPPAARVLNTDSTPTRTLGDPGSQNRGTSVPPRTVPRPAGSAPQDRDFLPSRDEPWRPEEPQSLDDAGITGSMLEGLILRFLLSIGEAEGRKIANQVKLPFRLVVKTLEEIKSEHRVTLKAGTETNDYVYALTESGRRSAQSTTLECTYFGACPVTYSDYIASVRKQSIEGQSPNREDLKRSFADLLIDTNLFAKLGPAISSGRGMFLFGYPGNGKTSIAERVTSAFGKYIWIPVGCRNRWCHHAGL